MDNTTYELLSDSYKKIVFSVKEIANDFYSLLREVNAEGSIVEQGYSEEVFSKLLERANSELLSIAFFGAFSSGKSFLISALSNRVEYKVQQDQGQAREYFISRIPSSPRPTSSCPLAVEPLPTKEKEDKFWVFFEDQQVWEQKVPALPAIIQAYATDLPNASVNRVTPHDRNRRVLKARLGVSSTPFPARLYDLPGIGSTDATHEKIVREFIQQADCIVYIAAAQRSLSNDDLELLRHVYEHHKRTGKPVFFVLTQIDKAVDFDYVSGKPVWEDVRDANNEFLHKYFQDTDRGKPDLGFIGHGFIPVSAVLAAKAQHLMGTSAKEAEQLNRESRMEFLHEKFDNYLKNTSGPTHLIELTVEIQKLLTRLTTDIQARELAESTPRNKLQADLRGFKEKRSVLIEGKKILQAQLNDLGMAAIQRAFSGSDPDNLAQMLIERLEQKVLTRDVLKSDVVHEIEMERNTIIREWVTRDSKALIPRWQRAWDSFSSQADERVEKLLASSIKAQREAEDDPQNEADLGSISPQASQLYKGVGTNTLKDTFEVLSKAWQTYAFVASVGGASAAGAVITASPALAALGPVGWTLLASAVIGGSVAGWRLQQQRNERRNAMINDFPQYARGVVENYRLQANEFINLRIGQIIEFIDNEIERVSSSIDVLEQRQFSGEYLNSEKRLKVLADLVNRCSNAERLIFQQYNEAVKVQPQIISLISPNSRG